MPWNKSIIDRFLEKVSRRDDGECWEWMGKIKLNNACGLFCMNGTTIPAHRASYLLMRGEILDGMCITQKCNNRFCVNPDHLFTCSRADHRSVSGKVRTDGRIQDGAFFFRVGGKEAVVDEEDAKYVKPWKWGLDRFGYVKRNAAHPDGGGRTVLTGIHRMILELSTGDGTMVDHIDGDKLNNRKSNLRLCTPSENQYNKGRSSRNTSGYKGVSRNHGKWSASIRKNGKQHHLGYFETAEAAYAAYCNAAREMHGEFAHHSLDMESA